MGRIVTFYSFKGGVGRTMALANVAYLCASQGMRVLVMDWDLEAPGLSYYFRGLVDLEEQAGLRDSPGALNVLWEWRTRLLAIRAPEQALAIADDYEGGEPFSRCVRSIIVPDEDHVGKLDYIGAGSNPIEGEEPMSYGEALSKFPWSQLHDGLLGGTLVESWRNWAKRNYELVLIDSRTGFADVAGLCTMAFPDEVVLCMALNKQNIDGTASVAAEVRRVRAGEVRLRAAPMRTARDGTGEQNGAIASARNLLARDGGFSEDQLMDDFDKLTVPAVEGVSFQETLAPFAASAAHFDPMTLTYCRMATALAGQEIIPPMISEAFRERVRRRQNVRTATIEYLQRFSELEPALALEEMDDLVASAQNLPGDSLSPGYINALIEAAYAIDTSVLDFGYHDVFERLIGLVRSLYRENSSGWEASFIQVLTSELSNTRGTINDGTSDSLSLYTELDAILADDERPSRMRLRLAYMRRGLRARLVSLAGDDPSQLAAVHECVQLATQLMDKVGEDAEAYSEALAARLEMVLILGDMATEQGALGEAKHWFEIVIATRVPAERGKSVANSELLNLIVQAHFRLALLPGSVMPPAQAAIYALEALTLLPGSGLSYYRLINLTRLFANPAVPAGLAGRYLTALRTNSARTSRIAAFNIPTQGSSLTGVIDALTDLYQRLARESWMTDELQVIPRLLIDLLGHIMARPRWSLQIVDGRLEAAMARMGETIRRNGGDAAALELELRAFMDIMRQATPAASQDL